MKHSHLFRRFSSIVLLTLVLVITSQSQPQSTRAQNLPWLPLTLRENQHSAISRKTPTSPAPNLFSSNTHLDTVMFTLYPAQLEGVICGDAVWIDYDNDNDLDIMVTGWNDSITVTKIYRNDNGVFTDINVDIPGIISERGVSWEDYDNDGDFDLAITGRADSAATIPVSKIYRNDNGTFVDINAPIIQLMGGSITWIDFNGDGKLDLLVTGARRYDAEFFSKLYQNTGDGFIEVPIYLPGVWGSSAAWGDYDNDSDPDLLLTGYGDYGVTTKLFENECHDDTVIAFTDKYTNLQTINSCGAAWGDYDNDGWLDILVSGDPPTWTWNTFSTIYHNNGNGTFTDIKPGLQPFCASYVAWGDYDNDGDLDVALSGWIDDNTNGTKIYRNDGGGVFSDIYADLPATWFGSLAWGDFDNDGMLDLLLTGGTTPQVYYATHYPYSPITVIYHNNLTNPNIVPSEPMVTSFSVNQNNVQLSWQQSSDDKTPTPALTYNIRIGTTPDGNNIVASSSNLATGQRRVPKTGNNGHLKTKKYKLLNGTYYWNVQAIDNSFGGSSFSETKSFTVGIPVDQPAWKMVSIPYIHEDMSRQFLFPSSVTPAYAFRDIYIANNTLQTGVGYWIKFPNSNFTSPLSGGSIESFSIPVKEGWNMIGSISSPVLATSITSTPSGMMTSEFFGYSGIYESITTITPGSGYWVKVNEDGFLHLSISSQQNSNARIRITPGNETPPPPPDGSTSSQIVPTKFLLSQNYPNPFNPVTNFQFSIENCQLTILKVFDLLGREVATLVNEVKQSGAYTVSWDASNFPSSVYYYRLQSGNHIETKKLILMK
ncbi:MAG: hypothetical protein C0417_03275 [Chlorobiaceae bacterium]|nr:hypothetical protein [Chlorobiaceae bacterium]